MSNKHIHPPLITDQSITLNDLMPGLPQKTRNPFAEGLHIGNIHNFRDILAVATEDLSDSNNSCSIHRFYLLLKRHFE